VLPQSPAPTNSPPYQCFPNPQPRPISHLTSASPNPSPNQFPTLPVLPQSPAPTNFPPYQCFPKPQPQPIPHLTSASPNPSPNQFPTLPVAYRSKVIQHIALKDPKIVFRRFQIYATAPKGGTTKLMVGGGSMHWKVGVNTVQTLTFEKGGGAGPPPPAPMVAPPRTAPQSKLRSSTVHSIDKYGHRCMM